MAGSSVMLSLPQMVDLALNSPEVGSVNFNILHSLLHVLIQQVDLLETKVEFKGNDSERVQNLMKKSSTGPSLNLTEYMVTPGKDQRKVVSRKQRYRPEKDNKDEVIMENEVRVVDQGKEESKLDALQTVILLESTEPSTTPPPAHVSVALSKVHFENLEDEIEKLKEDIKELKELPANVDLISAIRSANPSPVLDMFQILTLTKRIEASEEAVSKLASMIEDLAREQMTGGLTPSDASTPRGIAQSRQNATPSVASTATSTAASTAASAAASMAQSGAASMAQTGAASMAQSAAASVAGSAAASSAAPSAPGLEARVTELELHFKECSETIGVMDNTFNEQFTTLQQNLIDLEKEIGEIIERINAGLPGGDTGTSEQGGRELYNKVMMLQEELEKLAQTATKLLDDKDDRQSNMDALLEQIELLKTIKANREDLQDALANKADSCTVNKKVSHDQFDAACDELSRSIEEAVGKLTQQESLWQQALLDIQNEIENKLDKMELTPLRDFVHNKLKMLQDRLKALAALKQDTEAAGTKSRLLRNVNCLSCDKDVVMRKEIEPGTNPPPPSFPASKGLGPYLAYELDQLRKQQKFEYLCNRYCGGSHTTTTAQQRVARMGNFLQQWGTEAAATEKEIRGTDGLIYKARDQISMQQEQNVVTTDSQSMRSKPSILVQGDIVSERLIEKSSKSEAVDFRSLSKKSK
ncbi:hypothetical protein RN001_014289 [Aquatica leii]|uniref:DUF4795 domain-containing protein n=1 Tax=Aquatica leii TaxID=1421715 RepID=A0AAN7P1D8_9COLE|nr:hypothetical protein RN001_014289 [Aquatica leii]